MAQLLDLPRELRDMIYMALITAERPRPDFKHERWIPNGHKLYSYCATKPTRPPVNCAGLLQSNRQLNREMSQAIDKAKSKQAAALKLDYFIMDDDTSIVTWLRIPLVKTQPRLWKDEKDEMPRKWRLLGWPAPAIESYHCPHQISRPRCACRNTSTLLHQLWVDIRYPRTLGHEDDIHVIHCERWGICAALVDMLENGGDFSRQSPSRNIAMIDELVLNIVSPSLFDNGFVTYSRGTQTNGGNESNGLPTTDYEPAWVAQDLLGIWDTFWTSHALSKPFRILLERIRRVRICIDGETWRVRELQLELERGRAEERRIAARLMR